MSNRVALFLPSLRGGGAERVMVSLGNEFADRGYKVDLVLSRAEGPYLADVSHSVRVIDLEASRVLTSLPNLVRYLRRERPRVLLSAMSHANVVALAGRWLSRVPMRLVASEHTSFSVSMANNTSLGGRAMVHLARWGYPSADEIVAVSNGAAIDLTTILRLPSGRVHTIHNPVVSSSMLERSYQPMTHLWFGAGKPKVVLAVGRLVPAKDFHLLLHAFRKLRAEREVRLMILGEGELRHELEELVRQLNLEESVALPGFVSNPYAYMRNASLYVMSSKWEGFGNTLAEAMACGTPVVATDCPNGPAEILENGRWGRLVPVGDIDGLASAMAATLDEPSHPDVAARASHFSVDRAVTNYIQVLFPALR